MIKFGEIENIKIINWMWDQSLGWARGPQSMRGWGGAEEMSARPEND